MYFSEHYDLIRYPFAEQANQRGLRRAQRGAIHAIASHFTLRGEPAIVVMPTGSGKTAVLIMSAYILRSKRVLVVTPSRLVRNQIVEEFNSLRTLKAIGVLAEECPCPQVREIEGRITTLEGWKELEDYHVVIGTPNSTSPAISEVASPPEDLFDLILVDEAHHSPAHTWNELLKSFPKAKRILFTATPFRRDKREIEGYPLYVYPLGEAFKDHVFGRIEYRSVEPKGENNDVAIAKAAELTIQQDRANGAAHSLMIRTDSRKRADELKDVYAAHTSLRLEVIHSGGNRSLRRIKQFLEQLRVGQLDGIICVDMLGEGFDFPQLKIAAIHAPHKSLAVTLQFIGRFARTNTANVGTAKFLAVPSEIEVEGEKLYEEDAAWQEIVINLSETRIEEEVKFSHDLSSFEQTIEGYFDYRNISLHALRPYFHVKIYRVDVDAEVNIEKSATFISPLEVVRSEVSTTLNSCIFLTREVQLPRWTNIEALARIEHDLFIVHYNAATRLLFISASRKSIDLYEKIATLFTSGRHSILPQSKVNNVLATLNDFEFFNIGMRRRALHPNAETYRISAGPSTQNAVDPTDGRMYVRGHVYCSAEDNEGRRVNLGYSSAAKVWSNRTDRIPGLIDWIQTLAHRISNYTNFSTGSPIDHLSVGEEIEEIPAGVIAACWDSDTYQHSRGLVGLPDSLGDCQLIDVDLSVDHTASKTGVVRLKLSIESEEILIDHSISNSRLVFERVNENSEAILITVNHENIPLLDYLKNHPPLLFLQDFSVISHGQLVRQDEEFSPFNNEQIEAIDWHDLGVDISREFTMPSTKNLDSASQLSIHDYLINHLPTQPIQILFYDHRSGEMADFITFHLKNEVLTVQFFHCKGAHGAAAGSRTDDVYEVACQVVKSLIWLKNLSSLKNRIHKREETGSRYIKGDRSELERIVREAKNSQLKFEMILVQPGISRSGLRNNVSTVLAAADRFIVSNNCEKLRVWGAE